MKKLITCLSFALAAVSVGYAAVTPYGCATRVFRPMEAK